MADGEPTFINHAVPDQYMEGLIKNNCPSNSVTASIFLHNYCYVPVPVQSKLRTSFILRTPMAIQVKRVNDLC